MRQQEELLRRVEGREIADPPAARQHGPQAPVREHPREEVRAQGGNLEPPLLLHRQAGDRVHERGGERPAPVARRRGPRPGINVEDRNAEQPAARRVLLEDVAVRVERAQLGDPPRREPAHPRRMIGAAVHPPEARSVLAAHQADRLARRAHAHLDLGTDRDVADERRQRIGDEGVAPVAAVVAHAVPQQAPRHADADLLPAGRRARGMVPAWLPARLSTRHDVDRV